MKESIKYWGRYQRTRNNAEGERWGLSKATALAAFASRRHKGRTECDSAAYTLGIFHGVKICD